MQGSSLLILSARLIDFSARALTEVVASSARGPVAGCSRLCATGRWCRSRLLALQGVDHAHRPEAEQVERATALPAKHALRVTEGSAITDDEVSRTVTCVGECDATLCLFGNRAPLPGVLYTGH